MKNNIQLGKSLTDAEFTINQIVNILDKLNEKSGRKTN
jgi:hypothetical protein